MVPEVPVPPAPPSAVLQLPAAPPAPEVVPPGDAFTQPSWPEVDLTQISDALQGAVQSVDTTAIQDTISDPEVQSYVSSSAVVAGLGIATISSALLSLKKKTDLEGSDTEARHWSRKHLERSGGCWRSVISLLRAESFLGVEFSDLSDPTRVPGGKGSSFVG